MSDAVEMDQSTNSTRVLAVTLIIHPSTQLQQSPNQPGTHSFDMPFYDGNISSTADQEWM